MSPMESHVATGVSGCIQNPQSCTNMGQLESAWKQGMSEATTATKNWVDLVKSLFLQQPMPAPVNPTTVPGLPPSAPVYTTPYP